MKLSDMLKSLAESTRNLEAQLDDWNKNLSAEGAELVAKAKEWRQTAEIRANEWAAQAQAYSDGVDADLKDQWTKLQTGFDAQITSVRQQAAEWRAEADRKDAATAAKWHEAYAANMVTLAKRAEQEASEAIAAAAVARGKAQATKAG